MVGVEIGQQRRDVDAVRRHRADRDGAANQLGQLLDRDVDVGDGGKGRPGVRQRGLTGGGQPHGATRPVQQRLSEFAFQPLDLGTDRWLRDVDALGRASEVGLLGDGDEILELPQFHSR